MDDELSFKIQPVDMTENQMPVYRASKDRAVRAAQRFANTFDKPYEVHAKIRLTWACVETVTP